MPQSPTPRLAALALALAAAGCAQPTAPTPPSRAPALAPAPGERLFPEPPADFLTLPDGRLRGRLEAFEYDSTVTGTRRRAQVYLPPGHTRERPLPVLYLLHGIAGNDHEWSGYVKADAIVDRLVWLGQAEPMIVVMPNGRALADDTPGPNPFAADKVAGFARFEAELLEVLIPAVEARYGARTDRLGRALAGLSMGGGQALNVGLAHLDRFAWVGAFSAAPIARPVGELLPDPGAARSQLRLLYLSCGRRDGLIGTSQRTHGDLVRIGVPHLWNVDDHGHDRQAWASNLYHFAQRIFR